MNPYVATLELWTGTPQFQHVPPGGKQFYKFKCTRHIRAASFAYREEEAVQQMKRDVAREFREESPDTPRMDLRVAMAGPPVTAEDYELIAKTIRKRAEKDRAFP